MIDDVRSGRIQTTTLGGPPGYAGLTARNLGADVTILTKFGADLPEDYLLWLIRNQLQIDRDARSMTHPTTRFRIVQTPEGRELYLKARCEDLKAAEDRLEGDAAIVSPVAGEVDLALLAQIRSRFKTVYLDPQGFVRRFRSDGQCYLDRIDQRVLEHTDIIKMDEEEASMITSSRDPLRALEDVMKKGVGVAIYTGGAESTLLRCGEGVFRIPVVRRVEAVDTTGAGDIFGGAFTAAYLQGEDPVWSGCVAVAAASVGLDRVGLSKVLGIEAVAGLAEETAEGVKKIG